MRVLVVTIVHHPMDARILSRQIQALSDAGHEVTYVAPWSATGTRRPKGLQTLDVPRATERRRLRAIFAARRCLRAQAANADVILLHDPELLLAARSIHDTPVVWDVHEDTAGALVDKRWMPRRLQSVVARLVRWLEAWAERRFHLILADEGYQHRFASNHPVVPNDTVVPEQVLPPGDDRVIYVGRISAGRGAFEMLRLAELLPEGTCLELIGPVDADVESALREAHERGLVRWTDRLPYLEAQKRIEGALAGLSLLRDQPNYRHSRSTKVVEYMARGVPVITTPNPVATAIIEQHGGGVVVPFEDPGAVAKAIDELRSSPDERQRLIADGRRAAMEHYNWSSSRRRLLHALEEVCIRFGTAHRR